MHFSDNYDYKEICEDYLTNEVNNVDFGYRYYAYFNDKLYSQFVIVGITHTLHIIGFAHISRCLFRCGASMVLSNSS